MSDENYWQAVVARDRQQDGAFVYGVRSTRVYCRPSCPSRRPNREQVVFFRLPEAAEQAGFRACLRCHPGDAEIREPHLELVRRACRYIEENLDGQVTLSALGDEIGLSPYHLQRLFKRVMGITPRQYADACRLDHFKGRLREGDSVTNALYDAGYGSSSRLYERAPAQLGMTPATYRRGGEQMHIGYTVVDCPLGRLLVAATERGVCAVSLGDSDAALEERLRGEYPAADIYSEAGGLNEWVRQLLEYMDGHRPNLDLPLDVQATAFQWRVWEALRTIPYGTTRSYSQVAAQLGQPSATRAVARACATNHVAMVIPCHRVVAADGGLGGYKWGVERKRALLEREQA